MKKALPSSFIPIFFSSQSFSQLLSWATGFLRQRNTPVVIIFDASKGNHRFLNYTATTDAYVHTGVIPNFSTKFSGGKHVKSKRKLFKEIPEP